VEEVVCEQDLRVQRQADGPREETLGVRCCDGIAWDGIAQPNDDGRSFG